MAGGRGGSDDGRTDGCWVGRCTLLQLVREVDAAERGDVGEVALAMPAKQVALQGLGVQDAAVVRRVHGAEVGVCVKPNNRRGQK